MSGLEPDQVQGLNALAAEAETAGPGPVPGETGPAPAPVNDGPPTAELLAPLVALGCAVFCPNWGIDDGQQKGLCDAYGALIDKYLPGGLGNYGAEFNALIITGAVFAPCIGKPRHAPADERAQTASEPVAVAEPKRAQAGALKPDEPQRPPVKPAKGHGGTL